MELKERKIMSPITTRIELENQVLENAIAVSEQMPHMGHIAQQQGFGDFTNNDAWGNFGNHDTSFSRANFTEDFYE
jgi:hypothetical protein